MGSTHTGAQHRGADHDRLGLNEMTSKVVIVGASHAGAELSIALRQVGHTGPVVMIGEERHLPYHRPPLSKAFLSAGATQQPQLLRPAATYEKANIEFVGGVQVCSIERAAKKLTFSDGRQIDYDKLALTTGARVRRLPFPGMELAANLLYLRTADDAVALRALLKPGARLVVIGGGYVGLEVAASASRMGLAVSVMEAMPRVLGRVTGTAMSSFYEGVHRDAGIALRTGMLCDGFALDDTGRTVVAVKCRDATSGAEDLVPADIVVVGIGVVPNTELAEAAGLVVNDGIVVDANARTSDPDIVAAGDCTRHPSELTGGHLRLESVQNAVEQARVAAATLCGVEKSYNAVPWFWSEQFDLKLQMVGLSQGHDEVVIRGDPAARSFAAFYLREGRLIAADVVNRPKEFMIARRLVGALARVAAQTLADESCDLATQVPQRETTIDASGIAAVG
jgi:3-phenylpropionate/trans-cinnamate dioxygenase ferredoxin reductase component